MRSYFIFLFIVFIASSGFQPQTQQEEGKKLFETHCIRCHGADGTKGFFGTGKLHKSKLDDTSIFARIQNGKSIMPPFKAKLKDTEIKALAEYVKTFRNTK